MRYGPHLNQTRWSISSWFFFFKKNNKRTQHWLTRWLLTHRRCLHASSLQALAAHASTIWRLINFPLWSPSDGASYNLQLATWYTAYCIYQYVIARNPWNSTSNARKPRSNQDVNFNFWFCLFYFVLFQWLIDITRAAWPTSSFKCFLQNLKTSPHLYPIHVSLRAPCSPIIK